jgi:hypothetical protein
MMKKDDENHRASSGSWRAPAVVLWLGICIAACSSLFEVENPNSALDEEWLSPIAATSLANGALYAVMEGYSYVLLVYSTVGDELDWSGSRDAFGKLDLGHIDDPLNEMSDQAFREFAPARWMCDEATKILEMHRDSNRLREEDHNDLARAYFYAAFVYTTVADFFEDFALSDRKRAAPPIGEDNMDSMYQTAIQYATDGLAQVDENPTLEKYLLAVRAHARYSLGIWTLVGKKPINTGLIGAAHAAAAAADAADALALDDTDWRYDLRHDATSPGNDLAYALNTRGEVRFGDEYIVPASGNRWRDVTAPDRGVLLQDPIDAFGDPRLDEIMTRLENPGEYAGVTLLSAREMHLILVEDALVRADTADFEANINALRAFSPTALTPFVSGGAGMPTNQEMLIHERQVNLFLQGHRLHDMYRFDIQASKWESSSAAYLVPGTFFPITKAEIDANCHINPDWPANVPCEG